jgi:hypothetical protein
MCYKNNFSSIVDLFLLYKDAFTSEKLMLQCSENGVIEKHFEMANYYVDVKECISDVDKDDRRSLVGKNRFSFFVFVLNVLLCKKKEMSF